MSKEPRMCAHCFYVYDPKLSACPSCADRELLELAAKAAGVPLRGRARVWWVNDGTPAGKHRIHCDSETLEMIDWNPLIDDGDALRLAKTLGLILDFRPWAVCIWKGRKQYNSYGGEASLEMHHVRNAIVNAAAEIGRAMS